MSATTTLTVTLTAPDQESVDRAGESLLVSIEDMGKSIVESADLDIRPSELEIRVLRS